MDIIITGHVEPEEAAAYGAFNYVGRIRPSDGYVVLFREPVRLQSRQRENIAKLYVTG